MRESIGGTWILSIVMTFLVLFTAYLAVSVNYAKAFRIKNYVISEIETVDIGDQETTSREVIKTTAFKTDMENYLINQSYVARGKCGDIKTKDYPGYELADKYLCSADDDDVCGVCVFVRSADGLDDYADQGNNKYYYTVVDFFKFDLPLLGDFLTFKVKGNSRAV